MFGFISSDGSVKIHKNDCPNASHIQERYPYRIIRANWSGKSGEMLPASLRVIGNDDIGIVANITSIISKEPNTMLRNISIDSHDGIFQGYLGGSMRCIPPRPPCRSPGGGPGLPSKLSISGRFLFLRVLKV